MVDFDRDLWAECAKLKVPRKKRKERKKEAPRSLLHISIFNYKRRKNQNQTKVLGFRKPKVILNKASAKRGV